jgi:hypothetical protein
VTAPEAPRSRIGLVASMAELIATSQAETPRVVDAVRQAALTDRFLTPALGALTDFFRELRAELDAVLRAEAPTFAAKPYPLGQCLRITEAVRTGLETVRADGLSASAAEGHAALRRFLEKGGAMQRAWGDLRGQYFQNALVVGALYVDVSNDTVVADKPPVEILPFAEAGFRPIGDYLHFTKIAERYWGYRFAPNHLVPELAPYLPLIQISPAGRVSLGPSYGYMLGLTLAGEFRPSEQVLAAAPIAPAFHAALAAALVDGPMPVAAGPDEGRAAALGWCRTYRAEGRIQCAATYNRARLAGQAANHRLARLKVLPVAGSRPAVA